MASTNKIKFSDTSDIVFSLPKICAAVEGINVSSDDGRLHNKRVSVCVCVFSAGMTLGSLLSLDTSLLISFNQPIMYCQPHSGILIGTLSQATLLPPPMSPHVENPHSMSWRNRDCQVTISSLLPLL